MSNYDSRSQSNNEEINNNKKDNKEENKAVLKVMIIQFLFHMRFINIKSYIHEVKAF